MIERIPESRRRFLSAWQSAEPVTCSWPRQPGRRSIAHIWLGGSRLEIGPRYQQKRTERHKEKARPIRSEPQESQAAPWRLQSIASGPGGIPATERPPPNSGACHVQDSADNEERAKSHQEHSRLLFVAAPHNTTGLKHPGSKTFRPSAVIQQIACRLESGMQTRADVNQPALNWADVLKQRRHLPDFQRTQKHRAVDEAQREGARLLAFQLCLLAERVDAGGDAGIGILLDGLTQPRDRPVERAEHFVEVLRLDAGCDAIERCLRYALLQHLFDAERRNHFLDPRHRHLQFAV